MNDAVTYGYLTVDGRIGPLLLGILRRALKVGGMAFEAESKRNDAELQQAFARAHVVWVLWPDENAPLGFSLMPAKRSPGDGK